MNTASLHAYPAHALVAMAREANRALVHHLQVGLTHAAVDAVKRRERYLALARAAKASAEREPAPGRQLLDSLHQILDTAIKDRWDLAQFREATSAAVASDRASSCALRQGTEALVGAEE